MFAYIRKFNIPYFIRFIEKCQWAVWAPKESTLQDELSQIMTLWKLKIKAVRNNVTLFITSLIKIT